LQSNSIDATDFSVLKTRKGKNRGSHQRAFLVMRNEEDAKTFHVNVFHAKRRENNRNNRDVLSAESTFFNAKQRLKMDEEALGRKVCMNNLVCE